jgi:two-component system phosphate regulon sensor histidine kinase PhoR
MKADKKKITSFENSPVHPSFVKADKDRIQQIVENLLEFYKIRKGERTY